jgi:hypothetical protein
MKRWALAALSLLLLLIVLYVSFLAFPQVAFSDSVRHGTVNVYYDDTDSEAMAKLAYNIDQRLRGCSFYDSSRTDRVFYCHEEGKFSIFTSLTRVNPAVQGFALSIFGNSFVSALRIAELAESSGGQPPYSIYEGSVAHIAAHEIAHVYICDSIGKSTWFDLPHWKQEGLPEYIANIGLLKADTMNTLVKRIHVLEDDSQWRGSRSTSWDRIHYEAGLLVEYLLEVEGRSLEYVISDSVTRAATLDAMAEWARTQQSGI